MFTGIVQARGTVRFLDSDLLCLDAPPIEEPWQIGESVAVNGCCLTVVSFEEGLRFDLSEETLRRTALSRLVPGSAVNLERAMRPTDRLGGHFVSGHVDAVGHLVSVEGETFTFEASGFDRYLIDKGSVAVDGISLTVVSPCEGQFSVAVIPHTLAVTTLGALKPGEPVNLEFDVLAKYVEKCLSAGAPRP